MKVVDMRVFFVITVIFAMTACASSQQTQPDFSELRSRSNQAHRDHQKVVTKKTSRRKPARKSKKHSASTPKKTRKPTSKLGVIRGEGSGSTRHEAVVSALQAVSAQVMSRVSGVTVTQDFEDDSESTGSVEQRLKAETAFPYAELIRVVDVQRTGADFVVTAELDRAEAIAALRKGVSDETRRFDREIPRIENALSSGDYAVLLSQRYNPSSFLQKRQLAERMLTGLGGTLPSKTLKRIEGLARRVAKARSTARLRLIMSGKSSATVRDATKNIFTDMLKMRGCQMTSGARKSPATVNVKLKIKTRAHEEFGAKWLYLGFQLQATTRDNQVVASINGMPEFVHGGGMSAAQAEQAALTELTKRLKQKSGLFDALICAESF